MSFINIFVLFIFFYQVSSFIIKVLSIATIVFFSQIVHKKYQTWKEFILINLYYQQLGVGWAYYELL